MYEDYTSQALPSKSYRELLGSAICVFNSNNAFIIENILKNDNKSQYNWYNLTDRISGCLKSPIREIIIKTSENSIANLFDSICEKRNRIIHSFQITDTDGEQRLATKNKNNTQYVITEGFLKDFIQENEQLSTELHRFRGY